MAHWAQVDENNLVTNVIVTSNDELDEGKAWIDENLDGTWVKTSYNTKQGKHSQGSTPLRKNFAQVGFVYNTELDAFIPPKPFDSWLLDEDTACWVAPVSYPADNVMYSWNEETLDWEPVQFGMEL